MLFETENGYYVLEGMVKRQYKIVNRLNIFNTVEYIQTYSLYSKKVSLRIIQIFIYSKIYSGQSKQMFIPSILRLIFHRETLTD